MKLHLLYDATGNVVDSIFCEEWDVVPDGLTKQAVPEGKIWTGSELINKDIMKPTQQAIIETI